MNPANCVIVKCTADMVTHGFIRIKGCKKKHRSRDVGQNGHGLASGFQSSPPPLARPPAVGSARSQPATKRQAGSAAAAVPQTLECAWAPSRLVGRVVCPPGCGDQRPSFAAGKCSLWKRAAALWQPARDSGSK